MHPYRDQPDRAFWRRAVVGRPWTDVPFDRSDAPVLSASTRIATAGSCFAANLLRWLPRLGLRPLVTEHAPPWFTEAEARSHGYREFAARYGNIYTARQFRQLVEEALGERPMLEEFATDACGTFDLLRPRVRPGGFRSVVEAKLDRTFHLDCVRRLLVDCGVFVFTLGLTEAWIDHRTDVVYPVCPGTAAGTFEPEHHRPVNFDYPSVVTDLEWIVDAVAEVNPSVRWILTVSPVPLVATHSDEPVVVATGYSKAVLRAAAGAVAASKPSVTYFPSYEIISSPQSMGAYLAPDLREVTEEGIAHVMRVFEAEFLDGAPADEATVDDDEVNASTELWMATEAALAAECDELLNDFGP